MSYSKEQFIEDFKNAYNQSQQLHFLYRYLKEYKGQIASVDVKKLEEEVDAVAYYQFIFTLDNGNIIESNSIAFASYEFVTELDSRITSINNTITSLDRRISNNEENIIDTNNRIDNTEDDLQNIHGEMLKLPNTPPAIRKVVTIDTNGVQDNVDSTSLTTLMDNIVDSHGNKRFVKGNITMERIEGITQTYGKWSLSGTHLMIVVCADVANGATISNRDIAYINLPAWVLNKINPLIASRIEMKTVPMYDISFNTQEITAVLTKDETKLAIVTRSATITLTADRKFRIQFDLLIDDE